MAENKLPDVPKLTFWQRLSGKSYNEAASKLVEYKTNLEQLMGQVEAEDERLHQKEEGLKEREAALKEREAEVEKKLRELEQAGKTVEVKEPEVKKVEDVEPTLTRDEIVIETIKTIKESAEKLGKIVHMNSGRKLTYSEERSLAEQRAEIRATLLAAVCAYRDSLPEIDRLAFTINGESCSSFLAGQARLISLDTKPAWLNGGTLEISEKALKALDTTYKRIAQGLGLTAGRAYESATYEPFSSRLALTDHRNAGPEVFRGCQGGRDYGLRLTGKAMEEPRTKNVSLEPTETEKQISETANTVKEWEKE